MYGFALLLLLLLHVLYHLICVMRWACIVALVIGLGVCEHFDLKGVYLPKTHSLSTVARFFLWSKLRSLEPDVNYRPPYGWGLWDQPYAQKAKIIGHEMAFTLKKPEVKISSYKLDLAFIEYDNFWTHFVPFQKESHFCCNQADVHSGHCPQEGGLLLPSEIRNSTFVMHVPISERKNHFADAEFDVPGSGIYFLMLVNCGEDIPPSIGSFSGRIIARGSHGYLSGMDVPKLQLYAMESAYTAFLGIAWAILSVKYRDQLIPLHNLIGVLIGLSLLENFGWYIYLSWANAMVTPSLFLLVIAILSTSVRNVVTSVFTILACRGYCISRPTMDPLFKVKLSVVVAVLCAFDLLAQIVTHLHIALDLSTPILALCVLQLAISYSAGFVWCFRSLNEVCQDLESRRQTAKQRQMIRFRAVLFLAACLFMFATSLECWTLTYDVRDVWPYEWFFTDGVPSILFTFVLSIIALIWRPTRSSRYYSYNVQVGDDIDIGKDKAIENTPEHDIRGWGSLELDLEDCSVQR